MKPNLSCTVVIPAYNASSTIKRTLESILTNLSEGDSVIVVDDGSSDDTIERAGDVDDRIKVVTQQNGGPSTARNHGIELATTELVAFCDADDIWHAGKLEKQRAMFAQNPDLALCFTDYCIIDENDVVSTASAVIDRELPTQHDLQSMLIKNPVMTSSTVASRQAMLDIGGFPQSYSEKHKVYLGTEDYEAWIAIAEKHPVAMVNEVLTSYLVQQGSIFQHRQANVEIAKEVANRRVDFINRIASRNTDKVSRLHTRKAIGDFFFRSSYVDRQDGHYGSAFGYIFRSIYYWPFRLKSWISIVYIAIFALRSFFTPNKG